MSSLEASIALLDLGRSTAWDVVRGLRDATADPARADRAVRALAGLGPRGWDRLDGELRAASTAHTGSDHWKATVERARQGDEPLPVLLTMSSHSGRERQMALSAPVLRSDPRLAPMLALRATDWVGPVRTKAHTTLLDSGFLLLPEVLGMLLYLEKRTRAQPVLEEMEQRLREVPAESLTALRRSTGPRVRRLAYRIWLESAALDAIAEAALAERDTLCRRLCAEHVSTQATGPALLERLLAARNAEVRAIALTGLVRLGFPEHGRAFLADRSASLRAIAQWAVRRAGDDPAELYRAIPMTAGAIAGLAECGDGQDVARVLPFLTHESPRVRAETVRAAAVLGGPATRLAEMITDPSPRVVRAVERADPTFDTEYLRTLLEDKERPRHVRDAALRRLLARDSVTRVETDLRLLTAVDPEFRDRAHRDLLDWMAQGATFYATLTPERRQRLSALTRAAEPAFGSDRTRRLRWILGLPRD